MKYLKTACGAALIALAASTAGAHDIGNKMEGVASWYGPGFHGRTTANGERFDQNGLTAAHRTLPFGTRLRVTNETTGKSVVVRVNDRGPYAGNRVLDLSRGAAEKIGLISKGVGEIEMEVIPGA